MAETKALIIFCEGAHDIAFVNQIFKYCFNAEKAKGVDKEGRKFSEYPAPFNQLFKTNVEKHADKDLSLDMAKKFFLPDRTLVMDDWIILLFNAGGADKSKEIKVFLKDFIILYSKAQVFPGEATSVIKEVKYLFLYDADCKTPNDVACRMQGQFVTIDDEEWECKEWSLNEWSIKENERGVIQADKALYVWAGENGKGTLEDLLYPIYQATKPELIDQSKQFIDNTFEWNTDTNKEKEKYAALAKVLKATICTAGQGKRPGRPLSAIIQDNVLGNKVNIIQAEPVKQFVNFITKFTSIS